MRQVTHFIHLSSALRDLNMSMAHLLVFFIVNQIKLPVHSNKSENKRDNTWRYNEMVHKSTAKWSGAKHEFNRLSAYREFQNQY